MTIPGKLNVNWVQGIMVCRYFKGNDHRGKISELNDIPERLTIIELHIRIDDFEGDTVVGKNNKGVLITFVDRTTYFTKL